jgi:RND family efflux transporter MFP subunit
VLKNWVKMKRRSVLAAALIIAVSAAGAYAARDYFLKSSSQQAAKVPQRARSVSVQTASAERKPVPVDVDAIGTVSPMASVALKSRIETTIIQVNFEDGARVKAGDVLFVLDSRQIDAQIAQAEATLAKDQSSLAGAERDLARFSELIAKGATTQVNLDNAKTQTNILRATVQADQALIDNLKVQKSYTVITAPISGRISAAAVKIGNFVRPADLSPLATINQIVPIYVTFAIPQRVLPDLRDAMARGESTVSVTQRNASKPETGKVTMIENTVDNTTGMVTGRAVMDNANETLWPGTLVSTKLSIRMEEAVIVPSVAVQRSQSGNFVFVVKDGKSVIQQVTIDRTYQGFSVVSAGLKGGETVVTDGQMLLSNGTAVEARGTKAGA